MRDAPDWFIADEKTEDYEVDDEADEAGVHQEYVRTITNWVIQRLYGSHDKVPDSTVFEPIQQRQSSQLKGGHVPGNVEVIESALLEIDHSQQGTGT